MKFGIIKPTNELIQLPPVKLASRIGRVLLSLTILVASPPNQSSTMFSSLQFISMSMLLLTSGKTKVPSPIKLYYRIYSGILTKIF